MRKSLIPAGLIGVLVENGMSAKRMSNDNKDNKERAWML